MTPRRPPARLVLGALAVCLLAPRAAAAGATAAEAGSVPLWLVGPFVGLLAAIALLPLLVPRWWGKKYPLVSLAFGAFVVAWYLLVRGEADPLAHRGLEYVSFISLIGSLYVASGGILIRVTRRGTPVVNTILLLLGAFLANVFGTTGASALLIRPFLRINRGHVRPYHVVFFIFLVSNCGGALTPIGDPPLFMGFIKGIDFWWVAEHAYGVWATVVLGLLATFFSIDAYHAWKRPGPEPPVGRTGIEFIGIGNFFWIFVILGAVFLIVPLGFGIPELIMVIAAAVAHRTSAPSVLEENEFDFHPIREVAILFAGIFATMVPALQYLEAHARDFGLDSPASYYFKTGVLSAFLDNTPTYLSFLTVAAGQQGLSLDRAADVAAFVAARPRILLAISMGAVFFGAATYIGNGPNFMVKSMAERAGVACPSFLGYMAKYAVPFLLPWLALAWALFFRGA
ncbi:MAG: sodium:proton antiporter [Planctomycetes bacterium]|nr:sodium:proton antiporter [Planctomycetota bacterium]